MRSKRFTQESEWIQPQPRQSDKTIGILGGLGIDGKLTGGDVVITLLGMCAAFVGGVLFGIAKLLDGYRLRDAVGCGADVVLVVVVLLLTRMVLDLFSVPAIVLSIFSDETDEIVREVVRNPVFVNRYGEPERQHIGLPNGAVVGVTLFREFLSEAVRIGGTAWGREYWCNKPDDKKRPGRGVMEQDQWNGIKMLLDDAGLWRTKDEAAAGEFLNRF